MLRPLVHSHSMQDLTQQLDLSVGGFAHLEKEGETVRA